jgi:hypothetical protein
MNEKKPKSPLEKPEKHEQSDSQNEGLVSNKEKDNSSTLEEVKKEKTYIESIGL